MTTTTRTLTDLRAAVCREPKDDTPRLVMADCLEENGDPEWSEFIRVGVELDRWKRDDAMVSLSPSGITRHAALRARSDALLTILEPRLRRGERCGRCGGNGMGHGWLSDPDRPNSRKWDCLDCHGTGWDGTLGEQFETDTGTDWGDGIYRGWTHRADFSRGFVSDVWATLSDVWAGDGPTAWGRALVAEWPVQRVWLTDGNVVVDCGANGGCWHPSLDLPQRVRQMVGLHTTEDAARLALATATADVLAGR